MARVQLIIPDEDRDRESLCTSAEVLQELAHIYLPVGRLQTLDAAMLLAARAGVEVWPLEEADVTLARQLHDQNPGLGARDLCHFASCRRRGVSEIITLRPDPRRGRRYEVSREIQINNTLR